MDQQLIMNFLVPKEHKIMRYAPGMGRLGQKCRLFNYSNKNTKQTPTFRYSCAWYAIFLSIHSKHNTSVLKLCICHYWMILIEYYDAWMSHPTRSACLIPVLVMSQAVLVHYHFAFEYVFVCICVCIHAWNAKQCNLNQTRHLVILTYKKKIKELN